MEKRIFVSFAMEDEAQKNLFCGQAKNDTVPYSFIDMSVKVPFDEKWKTQCRTRIKGCDGVIVIISKNTKNAQGAIWEINCAKEEKIPIRGIYTKDAGPLNCPKEISMFRCRTWSWENVKEFIESLP